MNHSKYYPKVALRTVQTKPSYIRRRRNHRFSPSSRNPDGLANLWITKHYPSHDRFIGNTGISCNSILCPSPLFSFPSQFLMGLPNHCQPLNSHRHHLVFLNSQRQPKFHNPQYKFAFSMKTFNPWFNYNSHLKVHRYQCKYYLASSTDEQSPNYVYVSIHL